MAAFWLRVRIRLASILRSSGIVWSYGLRLRRACLPRATRALPARRENLADDRLRRLPYQNQAHRYFRAVIACVAGSVVRLTNPVPAMETTQWITYRKKSSQ